MRSREILASRRPRVGRINRISGGAAPWYHTGADLGGAKGPVPPFQNFFTYMLLLL